MFSLARLCAAISVPLALAAWQQPHAIIAGQPIPSPEQIALLEQSVAKSPDNVETRVAALRAYAAAAPLRRDDYRAARLRHIEFLIQANPSSDIASSTLAWVGSTATPYANAADHGAVRALWLSEASQHFNDSSVVLNAVRFLAIEDKEQAEELLQRVVAARPSDERMASYLGFFYASGLLRADTLDGRVVAFLPDSLRNAWAVHCRAQLDDSTDARVLMAAATALPNMAMRRTGGGPEFEAMVKYADQLRARAAKAGEAAGRPKLFPQEVQLFADESKRGSEQTGLQVVGVPFTPNQITVAGNVQSAKVRLAPPPIYPPAAMRAGVQGTVRMQVVIGQDGLVRSVQLISGHPMLGQVALDAVRTWKYEPTVLNGVPVSVVTTVDVPFTLPPQ